MKKPRKQSKLYELSFQVEDISEKKTPLSELYEVNVQVEDVFEQKTLLCKLFCANVFQKETQLSKSEMQEPGDEDALLEKLYFG